MWKSIFTMVLMLAGCASPALQFMPYQVVRVQPSQIGGREAVRVRYPGDRWVIYLGSADPQVLEWEARQVAAGTTWDKI